MDPFRKGTCLLALLDERKGPISNGVGRSGCKQGRQQL
jgi:hypothetical protein